MLLIFTYHKILAFILKKISILKNLTILKLTIFFMIKILAFILKKPYKYLFL